jgi:hypothetical protein
MWRYCCIVDHCKLRPEQPVPSILATLQGHLHIDVLDGVPVDKACISKGLYEVCFTCLLSAVQPRLSTSDLQLIDQLESFLLGVVQIQASMSASHNSPFAAQQLLPAIHSGVRGRRW